MTRTQYAVMFAMVGAALAFWSRRNALTPSSIPRGTTGRGEVIFSNHIA